MAQLILAEGGVSIPVGYRWADRFLRRHDRLKMKPGIPLESSRVRGSTRERFENFFKDLRQFIADKNIKPRHITNMDEHSI